MSFVFVQKYTLIFQMLPSMPIIFTSNSRDAFGNKIEPSTSCFSPNPFTKPVRESEPPSSQAELTSKPDKRIDTHDPVEKEKNAPKIKPSVFETALTRSYYMKVQSRFSSHHSVPTNKFLQFQSILRSFDPIKETPLHLYKKIEDLFGEEHKDLVEEFLLFLKPEQAVEIGRFMDHFMVVQMTHFIKLLQETLYRKPTVLKKVLRAISTGINSGNSEDMKKRVLPHLRAHARLSKIFKSLFPDERPSDSFYKTGLDTLDESFLTNDNGYEMWEFEEEDDKKKDDKPNLDTMYLNGRVFLQHGKMLRAARVTYPYSKEPYRAHTRRLAPAHCRISPTDSEEEKSSPKKNKTPKVPTKRARKQPKSPTKNIKDVNGNTKNACTVSNSPKSVKAKSKGNTKSKCKEKKEIEKLETVKKETKKEREKSVDQKEATKVKQIKLDVFTVEEKKSNVKSTNWTREEDKTMLQVLKGEAGSEQTFCRIRELLPHRTTAEIKERFCHVMKLLQQMAVGEVT